MQGKQPSYLWEYLPEQDKLRRHVEADSNTACGIVIDWQALGPDQDSWFSDHDRPAEDITFCEACRGSR